MASLKEIKGRIASVKSTQKITSAMRMVASAKLHRTQGMTEDFLRYQHSLQEMVDLLMGKEAGGKEAGGKEAGGKEAGVRRNASNLQTTDSLTTDSLTTDSLTTAGRGPLLIPISSSSGLCGSFNSNVARATFDRLDQLRDEGIQPLVLPIGKKIAHDLRRANVACDTRFVNLAEDIGKHANFGDAVQLVRHLLTLANDGQIDGAEFIHHHFKSMGLQLLRFTPMTLHMPTVAPLAHEQWLTEPDAATLLQSLFPRLLNAQAYGILLDSLTSEHAARMLAMQTADDNANDLLRQLTLLYNKSRQQAITNELIDIMGGSIGKD